MSVQDVEEDEEAPAPPPTLDREFLANASNPVLSTFETLKEKASSYWVWSRRGDELVGVAHSSANEFNIKPRPIHEFVSSIAKATPQERLNCAVLNSSTDPWLVYWGEDWLLVLCDVPAALAIYTYDEMLS